MNILSLTYEYLPIGGGGSVAAASLNEALAADGDRVRVVTSSMRGLPAHERMRGVDVHRVPCWRRHRHMATWPELATTLLPSYRAAAALIEAERPDLIHTHFVLPSGWVAHRLARKYGIPYVLTAHGSDIPGYNPDRFATLHRLLAPVWRRIVRDAAVVTSPSHYLAALVRRRLDVEITVIPNGYAPPPQAAARAKRKLVLLVARLWPRKGVEHFIDAAAGLSPDWEFVVAGDGPIRGQLEARAAKRGAPIRFAGFVDKTALNELYAEARILVFPSLRENFPMVLLEGMDAGCAVITTDAEGCVEAVGNAGVIVPRGEAHGLRRAMRALMADPERCRQLGADALARARQFRWDGLAERYRSCFEAVWRGAHRAGSGGFDPAYAGQTPARASAQQSGRMTERTQRSASSGQDTPESHPDRVSGGAAGQRSAPRG